MTTPMNTDVKADLITQNKETFLNICRRDIHRNGLEDLLHWLENETDFFIAPASAGHHGNTKGALVEHSINVWTALNALLDKFDWINVSAETRAIVALFHDVCKHDCYSIEMKNRKIYDKDVVDCANPKEIKKDSKGYYIWDSVPEYTFSDPFPIGHGEKSVIEILKRMKLTDEEIGAIRWHMGGFDSAFRGGDRGLNGVYDSSNLAVLLHLADMIATYILEDNK